MKIKENTGALDKLVGRVDRQNLPDPAEKPNFASLLASQNMAGLPLSQAQAHNPPPPPMTLQDYRAHAIPVRLQVQREKAVQEIMKMTGDNGPKVPEKMQKLIQEAAQKYKLPPQLITAVIKVESNFNPRAVSSEGACGLMQLMPATAKKLGIKNIFDLKQNIDAGSRFLKDMLERFHGKVDLALAAYNAGPGAVEKHKGIPPYKETQRYVKKVLAYC